MAAVLVATRQAIMLRVVISATAVDFVTAPAIIVSHVVVVEAIAPTMPVEMVDDDAVDGNIVDGDIVVVRRRLSSAATTSAVCTTPIMTTGVHRVVHTMHFGRTVGVDVVVLVETINSESVTGIAINYDFDVWHRDAGNAQRVVVPQRHSCIDRRCCDAPDVRRGFGCTKNCAGLSKVRVTA